MVVKRKLSCGSNGFEFCKIPKAPRSSRRKVSSKSDDNQTCAIDLLASLAGKLLEESESSSTSTYAFEGDNHDHLGGVIKQEHEDHYNRHCKPEFYDQGNLVSKSTSENTSVTGLHFSSLENDCILEQTPISDCKKRDLSLKLLAGCENEKGDCDFLVQSGGITEEAGVVNVDAGFKKEEETCGVEDEGLIADTFTLKDPSQSPESVHLDRNVKLSPFTDHVHNDSFEGYENHSKLVCRDDDENYCKYYKFSEKCKSYRPPTRVGNRRIKKSVMTKYGRAGPKLKCFEDTRTDARLKALYRKRKLCYNPFKRETVHRNRRLSDKALVVNYDGALSSESVSNSPKKGELESGVLSTAKGIHSKDSRVKLSIKSLRIPELFIEVPETATVGSLKRIVKEAVTALLGGGIHIGVLVQGKKVRDDNNTLSETGLSCRENIGSLGFTLEPGLETLPVPLCSENPVVSMPADSTNLSKRFAAASPAFDSRTSLPLQDADHLIKSGNVVASSHELVPYHSDISADEQPSSDSRELVPVSALEPETLAIVPVNEKPKRTEVSQRRTRRPFSVTEVEALVHAVEELGTGRWRDVKLSSFENASHRTYVDLKDKWKTLVHTASISPQQRRGEPVPQELLDRVLAAHRYWSQHQMKQNGKQQIPATMVVQLGSSM